jgi:pyruvate formate lyase activating enzyme
MREAMLYERLDNQRVHCYLCSHHCRISEGKSGVCMVRVNRGGTLYTLVYEQSISHQVDPIEKKPLFHFHPGTTSFSVATVGCNFRCRFCQNWVISQMLRDGGSLVGEPLSAEEMVSQARQAGCPSISYTYTEPTIFFEYAYDSARLAHEAGIKNVFVTNGYMTAEALETIKPYLDATNVDLKGFSEGFYRHTVGARLAPVLDSLKLMKKLGIWVEVTTLLVPGLNDSDTEISEAATFVAKELGLDTPWHLSRFYPAYKLTDVAPTPVETLRHARRIGQKAGLHYVYEGNVPGSPGEHTLCPQCGQTLIARHGYSILKYNITQGKCSKCGAEVAGVGL